MEVGQKLIAKKDYIKPDTGELALIKGKEYIVTDVMSGFFFVFKEVDDWEWFNVANYTDLFEEIAETIKD